MIEPNDILVKYEDRIKEFAAELAKEFLEHESNLVERFTCFDAEVTLSVTSMMNRIGRSLDISAMSYKTVCNSVGRQSAFSIVTTSNE